MMKRSLLSLAVLAGSLIFNPVAQATAHSDFFTFPSILQSNKVYLDASLYAYNSTEIEVADAPGKNLDYRDSGIKLGAKVFFSANPEANFSLFTTPYLGVGRSSLDTKGTITFNECIIISPYHCAHLRINDSAEFLASTRNYSLGVEGGIIFHAKPAIFQVTADISRNLTGYKAFGFGTKFGLGFKFGRSSMLYIDAGFKYFGKGKWEEMQKSGVYDRFMEFPIKLTGLDGVRAFSLSIGYSF